MLWRFIEFIDFSIEVLGHVAASTTTGEPFSKLNIYISYGRSVSSSCMSYKYSYNGTFTEIKYKCSWSVEMFILSCRLVSLSQYIFKDCYCKLCIHYLNQHVKLIFMSGWFLLSGTFVKHFEMNRIIKEFPLIDQWKLTHLNIIWTFTDEV